MAVRLSPLLARVSREQGGCSARWRVWAFPCAAKLILSWSGSSSATSTACWPMEQRSFRSKSRRGGKGVAGICSIAQAKAARSFLVPGSIVLMSAKSYCCTQILARTRARRRSIVLQSRSRVQMYAKSHGTLRLTATGPPVVARFNPVLCFMPQKNSISLDQSIRLGFLGRSFLLI